MHFYLFIVCVGAGVCILVGGTHVGGQNLGQSEANLRCCSSGALKLFFFPRQGLTGHAFNPNTAF